MNKLYFHTRKHIYLEYFNDEIVVLNLRKNQYVILGKEISHHLFLLLKKGFERVNGRFMSSSNSSQKTIDLTEQVKSLREFGILSSKFYDCPSPKVLEKRKITPGVANIDWRLQHGELDTKASKKLVWQFYLLLIKVHFVVNILGFESLIRSIQRKKKTYKKFLAVNPEKFGTLVTALNRACFYFPFKTKCLEWASALTLMGLKNKWQCNMEVGVHTLPFSAHAWVNVNGSVIADLPDLQENLAIVLSEPF